jgi:hypothetical protein
MRKGIPVELFASFGDPQQMGIFCDDLEPFSSPLSGFLHFLIAGGLNGEVGRRLGSVSG